MNNSSFPKKTALALTGLLLLLAAGCILWLILAKGPSDHCVAQIYQDGVLLESIDLSRVEAPYEFTVSGKDGASNTLRVTRDSIGIISANCPDRICVHQGFIRTPLLPITCLPNHLVIQLVPRDSVGPDATTY